MPYSFPYEGLAFNAITKASDIGSRLETIITMLIFHVVYYFPIYRIQKIHNLYVSQTDYSKSFLM